jgi:hypothetical protein
MTTRKHHHLLLGIGLVAALPWLMGAEGSGCGTDVDVGAEGECVVGGCSGQLCLEPGDDTASTCEWSDVYACYQQLGVCERAADGACGWRPTQELQDCIDAGGPNPPEPEPCVVGGCSGTLCLDPADEPLGSTCEWSPSYACYDAVGICERDASGACGWRDTPELEACLADDRVPTSGACVRSTEDACETDADCVSGGCGGELCFNPAVSSGASTCECTAPSLGCGCVFGRCTWFE